MLVSTIFTLYLPSSLIYKVNPEDAPKAISQAVASLPPEQMYALMKDMKGVIMVR